MARAQGAAASLTGMPGRAFDPGAWAAAGRAMLATLLRREADHRSGFLWLPVAFGLGILAYFQAAEEPALWAGPALALSCLLLALRGGPARALFGAGAFVALGFFAGGLRTRVVATPMLERPMLAEVKGFVEGLDETPARHRLTIRPTAIKGVEERNLPFRLRVGVPGKPGVKPGDHIVLTARLSPPSEAAMPGGYDFRREAFFRGAGGAGYALRPARLEPAPGEAPLMLRVNAAIDHWRNLLTSRIARAIGAEAGALSAALVTGKRGLIPEETNDDLRASGLYHIVSISGLHMVLAAGVLFWTIRAGLAAVPALALRYPIKKIAAFFAMFGATFYCLFSGSEVATERSLIMTLVMLGAILVDRPALAMRNLALSALLCLAREPEALMGPSFQMSFAAVAGLIAANQIWRDWRAGRTPAERGPFARMALKLMLAFAGIGATTLVATLATAPFSAFHFHRLNPYGLIGNSLAIPLVSLVVMPGAVMGTLLVPFGFDGLVWRIMGQGVEGVLVVAERVAAIENASFPVARMPGYSLALLVGALLLLVGLRTRLRLAALVPLALWGASVQAVAPPDLIIDPSGRMLLARGEGGRYRLLSLGTPSRFTLAQWLPALGDARMPDDPSLKAGVACDRTGCTTRLADGRRLALSGAAHGLREDCRRADLVVTPLPGLAACAQIPALAADHFERHGATRVFLARAGETRNAEAPAAGAPAAGNWRLETGLDGVAERPWRRRRAPERRSGDLPAGGESLAEAAASAQSWPGERLPAESLAAGSSPGGRVPAKARPLLPPPPEPADIDEAQ